MVDLPPNQLGPGWQKRAWKTAWSCWTRCGLDLGGLVGWVRLEL